MRGSHWFGDDNTNSSPQRAKKRTSIALSGAYPAKTIDSYFVKRQKGVKQPLKEEEKAKSTDEYHLEEHDHSTPRAPFDGTILQPAGPAQQEQPENEEAAVDESSTVVGTTTRDTNLCVAMNPLEQQVQNDDNDDVIRATVPIDASKTHAAVVTSSSEAGIANVLIVLNQDRQSAPAQ